MWEHNLPLWLIFRTIGLTDLPKSQLAIVCPAHSSPTSLPCTLYNLSKTIDTFLCFLQSQVGTHVYRLSLPRVLYVTTPGPSEPGIQGTYILVGKPSLSKHFELLLLDSLIGSDLACIIQYIAGSFSISP